MRLPWYTVNYSHFQFNPSKFDYDPSNSLGGALATLAVAELRENLPISGLYTFGSPRVGKDDFVRQLESNNFGKRTFRVVNGNDLVPRVPPSLQGYHHVGTVVFFDADGKPRINPDAWTEFKQRVKVDFQADVLDKQLTWIEHHLLSGDHGYIKMLDNALSTHNGT